MTGHACSAPNILLPAQLHARPAAVSELWNDSRTKQSTRAQCDRVLSLAPNMPLQLLTSREPNDIDASLLHDSHAFTDLKVGWFHSADVDTPAFGFDDAMAAPL